MVDKAYEFPLTEVDDSLWHIHCHVNDCNFFVVRSDSLVSEERVVHHPGLSDRELRIVSHFQFILILLLI